MVVGPLPPPFHGCSVATSWVLHSRISSVCEITHLDTSDHRSLNNLGRWDPSNIGLALKVITRAAFVCIVRRPKIIYIPISQNTAGFLRDAFLVWCGVALARAQVIVHLHGAMFLQFYGEASPLVRGFVSATMKRVHTGIVLGAGLKPHLATWLPLNRIIVVPNGTDCSFPFLPRAPRVGTLTVVFLGVLGAAGRVPVKLGL